MRKKVREGRGGNADAQGGRLMDEFPGGKLHWGRQVWSSVFGVIF